jgi:hypothetical protein
MKLSRLFQISFDLALEATNSNESQSVIYSSSGLDAVSFIKEYKLIKLKYPRQIGKTTIVKNRLKEIEQYSKETKVEYYSQFQESNRTFKELLDFISVNKINALILDDVNSTLVSKLIKHMSETLKTNKNSVGICDLPMIIWIE